ncbi:MAG: hypothetical protein ACM3S1_15800 [Hyphomicrobiales bacterium]
MVIHRRRLAVFGLILLFAAVIGGQQLRTPAPAIAQGGETFEAPNPPKLYVGDISHTFLEPRVSQGLHGYCLQVREEGHVALGANNGFEIAATTYGGAPFVPAVIEDSVYFDNGSATTTDDVYCLSIRALPRPAGTALPGDPFEPNPPIIINWHYLDTSTNTAFVATSDPIAVAEVRLVGFDGPVGGRALICTEGWDPAFLTGETSNSADAPPNTNDQVQAGDWVVNSGGVSLLGQPFVNTTDFTSVNPDDPDNPLPRREWCISLTAAAPVNGISVDFSFVAIYDAGITDDDSAQTENSLAADVDIFTPAEPEIRHALDSGHLIESARATPNAVRAVHTVCVMSSTAGDTLDSVTGVDVAVTPFHDSDPTNGIPDGTLCFSWSRTAPGTDIVTAYVDFNANPYFGTAANVRASWDTDDDNNGYPDADTGQQDLGDLLVKDWFLARTTVISTGDSPDVGDVTNKEVALPVGFNAGSGGFFGSLALNEWVLGTIDEDGEDFELLDGISLHLVIDGKCGHFEGDGLADGTQVIDTVSVAGHFPFTVDISPDSVDTGCVPGDTLVVRIDTFYADGSSTGIPQETVTIKVGGDDGQFFPPESSPQVAYVGQTVTIVYGFAGSDCDNMVATFTRSKTQKGTFVGRGIVNGADSAVVDFDEDDCSATVGYESEDPGEVDIIATFTDLDGDFSSDFNKIHFPIFFVALEDVTVNADSQLTVSEHGSMTADVRVWFPGTNPSGRPEEVKPDGRVLPADRWVLPDDWPILRGERPSWPTSAPIPETRVTFLMQNEGIVNSFQTGENRGASGFFVLDGSGGEQDFNVNPQTGQPSALGTEEHPRIISEITRNGFANTGIYGDFNLRFEGCDKNVLTGNPYCEPDDVVGGARYYAVADYPDRISNVALQKGKWPPVASNEVATTFTWQGYKRLSVVDTADPGIKYLVVHLKDRDGFCDADSLHNVLGNTVRFEIDSGGGIILDAQDRPATVRADKRAATATTFDTTDDAGDPMNDTLVRPTLADDECQAWIRISNSLLSATNVLVTIPAPPVPIPGDVDITNLVCDRTSGFVTVTNNGSNPVSLAGFGVRIPSNTFPPEEHLGLEGYLEPGQSATFSLNSDLAPWITTKSPTFDPIDGARLVWNDFEVSAMTCDGEQSNPPLPATLPLDTEGEIVLDMTIPFGEQTSQPLVEGWNLVTAPASAAVNNVLGQDADKVASIYRWDAASKSWQRFIAGAPQYLNSLQSFEAGEVYWVEVKQPFTLRMTR